MAISGYAISVDRSLLRAAPNVIVMVGNGYRQCASVRSVHFTGKRVTGKVNFTDAFFVTYNFLTFKCLKTLIIFYIFNSTETEYIR